MRASCSSISTLVGDPGDPAAHQVQGFCQAILANLRQEATQYRLFYLHPEPPLADIPGARWWRRLRMVGLGEELIMVLCSAKLWY
jgi:hypothetical protein